MVKKGSYDNSHDAVRIERPATGGGVGRLADGRVVFVRHSLPGELVTVDVTESTASFSRADVVEVLESSAERVSAPCPYAHRGGCGGCDLQHASLSAQKSWKAALVQEHLARIARVTRTVEVVSPPSPARGSRTRLRCAVDEEGRLSLRKTRSHDLVALDACWIADETFSPAFASTWEGAEEVELRAIGDGEPFAVVRRDTHRGTMIELCSLRGEPLEPSIQLLLERGDAHHQAGDHVVDLFSGVGLFIIPLARVVGPTGRVSAVESSAYAVRDARQNAEGLGQVKVREWTVSPRAINDAVGSGDVVVLDPPRSGLAKGVTEALLRRAPRRVVYVSCDAATFSRDLKGLLAGGFDLVDLKAFDLFPMTEHVELVALLDMGPQKVESS